MKKSWENLTWTLTYPDSFALHRRATSKKFYQLFSKRCLAIVKRVFKFSTKIIKFCTILIENENFWEICDIKCDIRFSLALHRRATSKKFFHLFSKRCLAIVKRVFKFSTKIIKFCTILIEKENFLEICDKIVTFWLQNASLVLTFWFFG